MPRALALIAAWSLAGCHSPDDSLHDSQTDDTARLRVPDTRSIQLTDRDHSTPPSWVLEHAEGTRDPNEIRVEMSWYEGLVSITLLPATALDTGLLPFIPHLVDEHDLQQAVLERGTSRAARWWQGSSTRSRTWATTSSPAGSRR